MVEIDRNDDQGGLIDRKRLLMEDDQQWLMMFND